MNYIMCKKLTHYWFRNVATLIVSYSIIVFYYIKNTKMITLLPVMILSVVIGLFPATDL